MSARQRQTRPPIALTLLATPDRQHDDLELRVGTWTHRCDSYYFAIDPSREPRTESRSKTRQIVAALLTAVERAVRRAGPGARVLFPYDFSDPYVGLLELLVDDAERLAVRRVVSTRMAGYAIAPSRAMRLAHEAWGSLDPWPLGGGDGAIVLPRPEVIAGLRGSAAHALRFARGR